MMTSSNESIFRVTGPLWGKFHRSPPRVFPSQRPVTRSFRRHRAYCDVPVMWQLWPWFAGSNLNKFFVMEKLTNGAVVTPTPGLRGSWGTVWRQQTVFCIILGVQSAFYWFDRCFYSKRTAVTNHKPFVHQTFYWFVYNSTVNVLDWWVIIETGSCVIKRVMLYTGQF